MTITWYPGHMGKALEQIEDLIRRTDIIIEVLDARLPRSSANHQLAGLGSHKPRIKVLNKADLADPAVTKAWVAAFERTAGVKALPLIARSQADAKQLIKLAQRMVPNRGKPGYPVRVMVAGIPNVGKSTLINTLAGKALAKVGDKPAVTTAVQRIELGPGVVLLDTPGVLWPDMDDQTAAHRLAASGAIGVSAFDPYNVGCFAADFLASRYPAALMERYKLEALPEGAEALLDAAGRRLGCLAAGGAVDLTRTAEAFLRDLRGGKLGRISFEAPEDEPGEEPATVD